MTAIEDALYVDLYELTMLQAYYAEGAEEAAVFDLHIRSLPPERNFLLACGLEDVLAYLETLRFSPEAMEYLASLGQFRPEFLERLADLRFTGSVDAVLDGTPLFAAEPILQVSAPLPEAQVVETFLLNQVTFQTLVASKGARSVLAAAGRPVVDFAARRTHGTEAGVKAARALYLAGFASTSNVLAGKRYGLPVSGTMAHSYVQAHDSEFAAFRAFASHFPDTALLVDTYDTEHGVEEVIRLARELGEAFRVQAVRLDSGDLAAHAVRARERLDAAGLGRVRILASGGLDEYAVAELRAAGAPIDLFAVGTKVGVSADAPSLESAYKLVAYAGRSRMKLSEGKVTLPGRQAGVSTIRGRPGRARRDRAARRATARRAAHPRGDARRPPPPAGRPRPAGEPRAGTHGDRETAAPTLAVGAGRSGLSGRGERPADGGAGATPTRDDPLTGPPGTHGAERRTGRLPA